MTSQRLHYHPGLKHLSRALRNDSTLAEVLLWKKLRARQMMGCQFLRQRPIGNYIADFVCLKLKLIVEVDGESHADKEAYDAARQQEFERLGFTELRLSDHLVKTHIDGAVNAIAYWVEDRLKTKNDDN